VRRVRLVDEKEDRSQPVRARVDGGGEAMVRARAAEGQDGAPAARERVGEDPLQLARLVAAVRRGVRAVVLEPQPARRSRRAQRRLESAHPSHRRRRAEPETRQRALERREAAVERRRFRHAAIMTQ
jgi:hypothetical protein